MIQEERLVPPKTPISQYLPKGLEKHQERERGFGIFEAGGPAAQNRLRHAGFQRGQLPSPLSPLAPQKALFVPGPMSIFSLR